MIVILGAGLAGISTSYHIGHEKCLLLEQKGKPFGHVKSEQRDGFTWDQGPHVSFTKHEYVKSLFHKSVEGEFQEIQAKVGNYYQGSWIAHPAQTSLHQVPEPLRGACLESFLATRTNDTDNPVSNYQQWLDAAFGPVFAKNFPVIYTKKYWTISAENLTTEWIAGRVLRPNVEDVKNGAIAALPRSLHYITAVRYPTSGGYQSFAQMLGDGANIRFGAEVTSIDLASKKVWLANGECVEYETLVNTLPLPVFISACAQVPAPVLAAARQLTCTQLLLVNVAAPHATQRPEHWIYVYDENKLTSRINFTELLSPRNAPEGWTGVQAEVYFSRHLPLPATPDEIGEIVQRELIEMGLIKPSLYPAGASSHAHVKYVPWANVVFHHDTVPALNVIWQWMESFGLKRDAADTSPLTDWSAVPDLVGKSEVYMAGRFAQWKYYWSDDCVLRGKQIAGYQE